MRIRDETIPKADFRVLASLLPYLWPKNEIGIKVRVVLAISFLIISKIVIVFVPLFYKEAVDSIANDTEKLISIPFFMIIAYGVSRIIASTFNELKEATFAKVGQRALRMTAIKMFIHLHSLSLKFHLDRKTGGLSRAIERGVKAISTILNFSVFNILPTIVEILFVCITLWILYDYRFMVITFTTLLIYVGYTIAITQWRTHFVRTMNKMDTEANSKAIDSLLNYETVKYFGNEIHETARYNKWLLQYEVAAIKGNQSLSVLNIGQGIIISLGLMGILWMAAQGIVHKTMTIGDFVLVNSYMIQLYGPLSILGFAYREIKLALVDMEQMFKLLEVKPEIKDKPDALPIKAQKGELVFEHVHFSYNPDREILNDISFKLAAGHTLAIVGESGAGKSTISRLIYRFYDVTGGRILIDGQDIRDASVDSVRALIGIVPQDTVLFNDTIYYNISYGRPNALQEEVIEAAKMAKIYDFIMMLPQGFDTMVGERGLKLSGGEKQRVAIARTLLKKPLIFLFDEATSSLDTHTEKAIQQSLMEVSHDHTTLIIAHRLSTIVDADKIIVLDKGQIVESGTHSSLLKKKGLYAAMWEKQSQLPSSSQVLIPVDVDTEQQA
jgi:ABC-type transport system involved in Fe-S cluster assembly fused permease/ATPase subunit